MGTAPDSEIRIRFAAGARIGGSELAVINEAWLQQVQEEAIEPDLAICDPHHHLRETPRYLLANLLKDIDSGHRIVSTVFVDSEAMYRTGGPVAMRPVGEVEFANAIAETCASGLNCTSTRVAAGIIGYADLMLGAAVGEVLDREIKAAPKRFRGIRHGVNWVADDGIRNNRSNPPPHRYLAQTFREGFAELAPRKLSFEAWCYHPQLGELTDLARAFPETTIVLNHLGGPLGVSSFSGRRQEVFADWSRMISELATCPNVVAKLGGLNLDFNGFGWHERARPPTSKELADAQRPYFEHALGTFGVERCMFESNFPSDKISCSYGVLWNSFKRITSDVPTTQKARLYHDNAARIYRLEA
jgi:predicted TIM-barrel fold metal-dependent hydrolase